MNSTPAHNYKLETETNTLFYWGWRLAAIDYVQHGGKLVDLSTETEVPESDVYETALDILQNDADSMNYSVVCMLEGFVEGLAQ